MWTTTKAVSLNRERETLTPLPFLLIECTFEKIILRHEPSKSSQSLLSLSLPILKANSLCVLWRVSEWMGAKGWTIERGIKSNRNSTQTLVRVERWILTINWNWIGDERERERAFFLLSLSLYLFNPSLFYLRSLISTHTQKLITFWPFFWVENTLTHSLVWMCVWGWMCEGGKADERKKAISVYIMLPWKMSLVSLSRTALIRGPDWHSHGELWQSITQSVPFFSLSPIRKSPRFLISAMCVCECILIGPVVFAEQLEAAGFWISVRGRESNL